MCIRDRCMCYQYWCNRLKYKAFRSVPRNFAIVCVLIDTIQVIYSTRRPYRSLSTDRSVTIILSRYAFVFGFIFKKSRRSQSITLISNQKQWDFIEIYSWKHNLKKSTFGDYRLREKLYEPVFEVACFHSFRWYMLNNVVFVTDLKS